MPHLFDPHTSHTAAAAAARSASTPAAHNAHNPHRVQETQMKAKNFVRDARVTDAVEIGELSALAMQETLVAALERPISQATRALFDARNFTEQWRSTLHTPPSAAHQIKVAIGEEKICAFAAIAPTQPLDFPSAHPAARALPKTRHAFEITNFEIAGKDWNCGHEARLLAALTDAVGKENTELYIWVFPSAENLTRVLDQAGFAPLGYQRELEIDGTRCAQHLWWTTF